MNYPKILLIAPISQKKDYCLDEWLTQIKNFTYPNYEIYLVDNSPDPEYHKELSKKWNIKIDYVQPMGDVRDYITASQNKLRDYFLAGDYDFAFSLECDVFIDENIMEYFMLYRVPIHNITYFIRRGERMTFCLQLETNKSLIKRNIVIDRQTGFHFMKGQVKPIWAYRLGWNNLVSAGIGCTMIHREVLKRIKFRVDLKNFPKSFSDSFFHWDVRRAQMPNYLDTRFLAEHKRFGTVANEDK